MDEKDYYKILDLNKNSSQEEIKKAYRKMAHKHHPDKQSGENSAEEFIDAMEAYHVLSDPEKRKEYDRCKCKKSAPFSKDKMPGASPIDKDSFDFDFCFNTSDPFFDFFEAFFGQPSGRANRKNAESSYDHRHYDDLLD